MRRCFQCGANTEPEALTRVGDGEFCAGCFAALLRESQGDEPERSSKVEATGVASMPERRTARAARARCLVCEEPIVVQSGINFLGGQLCASCGQDMAREIAAGTADASPGGAASDANSDASERVPSAQASLGFTPGAITEICAGCERPMPGPGSYRRIDGKPYCAACLPFYAGRGATSSSAGESAGHPGPAVRRPVVRQALRPERCDCCLRGLTDDDVELGGFWLCGACRGSDPQLAVVIASARHKRTLARLRRDLDDEGPGHGG